MERYGANMLAPVTHILPLTTIRRERILPLPGRILVRKGQRVSATDVVAEAGLSPEHLQLNIARGLGLSPDLADRQLQVTPGAQVAQGDVLAGPVGLAKRVVRAPRDGRVVLARDGQVLLEVDSPQYELKAGLPGTVIELLGERGVVVETTGALVQGVWGNGQVDYGPMVVLTKAPDDRLTPDQIDVSQRGAVVLGGHCGDENILQAAADLPLRGLILASLDPAIRPVAEKVRLPVVVIEGLGRIPMNPAAFKLLSTSEQREGSLNAAPWDRFSGSRPEVVIPLPSQGELPLPRDIDVFASGQQVRILRAPYKGMVGKIVSLRPRHTAFPSGIQAPAAEVRLESGENTVQPLANLEVLQ